MNLKLRKVLAITILISSVYIVRAQETELTPMDTLAMAVNKLQTDVHLLKKIKISGYLQVQYQVADSAGVPSFEGGNFPANVDKRFSVRRGRFRASYDNTTTQYVVQIDASERNVSIRDAYVYFTEPWLNSFALQAGIFKRPMSFENIYSSSMRESPERSRIIQTISPGERDLGAAIIFQAPKPSKWNILKIEAGMFNGTGNTGGDFDSKKDFIGNIGINKTTQNEKINYGFRLSYYNGGYRQANKFVYDGVGILSNGNLGFIVDSTETNKGKIGRREYVGADFQFNIDNPLGLTTLRAEYIQGTQPGTASTTVSPAVDPNTDTYLRNFNGGYIIFLQNVFQTKHQLVFKYDWYDPNTDVSGNEIGKAGTKLSRTDLKYSTIGIGWIYHWDENVKITVYGDMITNETSDNLSGFTKDIKDNVLTIRVQYKF